MMNKQRYNLKGSALAYGLVIMTVILIVLTSIITFVAGQTKYSLQTHAREEALQIAEAGIHFYKWYLAHTTDGRTTQQVQAFWTSGTVYGVDSPPYEAEYFDPSGGAVGKYQITVTPPTAGSTVVTVRSVGRTYKYPDVIRTVEVRFRRPSWSEYIFLSNESLNFGSGAEVFGKVRSNKGIRFDGYAHNIVTSAVPDYNDATHIGANEFGVHTHVNAPPGIGINNTFRSAEAPPAMTPIRPDVFGGGRSFPVASADFSGILGDLAYMKSEAIAGTNGSLYFDEAHNGRHIILNADDTFSIRTVLSFVSSTNQIKNYQGNWETYAIPNEGVIFVENNVWLEGTVNGKRVTVAAASLTTSAQKSVYLGKDIRYTAYDCSDIIGIIGQGDVEVYRDSEEDLRIDAAMIAQNGRVGRSLYSGGGGIDLYKDQLTIYGAIITNKPAGFYWGNGTGYQNRDYYYDNNLLYCPPPYFPVGTQYEMDLWEEK